MTCAQQRRTVHQLGLALAAWIYSAGATAATISQVPLFVATEVTPNVMLLFDNSGSMENILWTEDFNPATVYPSWGFQASATLFASGGTAYTLSGERDGVSKRITIPGRADRGNVRYLGNYLNYLLDRFPNNADLRGQVPGNVRIQVARDVAAGIVRDNQNLRFGLASFNPPNRSDNGPGGRINSACGTRTDALLDTIAAFEPTTNTPLAETFYEITRYFRGLDSFYNRNLRYTSPIEYRCQKNFVVVVTDGFPTFDIEFPANDPDDPDRRLPNWDGLAPLSRANTFPNFPRYSDGYQPEGSQGGEGYSLYLDDLAKFARETDMRPTGTDLTGRPFADPDFPIRNLITYTVGFAVANQMLEDAALYGDGRYFTANTASALSSALQTALNDVIARTSSAASVATNSTRLSADTRVYQARFSSSNWSGQLLAFDLEADGGVGARAWDAAEQIPEPGSRALFTINPSEATGLRGRNLVWSSLTAPQQNALNRNAQGVTDTLGRSRLEWLRGIRSDEAPLGLGFRSRGSVLGDIINSDPAFVGRQDFGFEALPGAEGASYAGFRSSTAYTSRPQMIYVGANDGFLHAFDAANGRERFGFVPDAVFPRLSRLTDPGYNSRHEYFVDGSPRVIDAYIGGRWETVLVGTLGAGGRSVFALRVTDPARFGPSDVLWEFSDANSADLGVSLPQPSIARLAGGQWVALIANGVNSGDQRAKLLVVDLGTGKLLRTLDTGVGSASAENGLFSPIAVDMNGDRLTDYVYAGDLQGNLWKFDLTAAQPNQWQVAFQSGGQPQPLFTACSADPCSADNRQPITARPEVGLNAQGGVIVYFGTGRYFAVGDNDFSARAQTQTFYAVQDRNDLGARNQRPVSGGRSVLLEQRVLSTVRLSNEDVRITSNEQLAADDEGWFLDLPVNGERQVSTPILRDGRIIFTTLIPSDDPCGFGGSSWLMELDAQTGARLEASPFDLNGDRIFDGGDLATITVDGKTLTVPVSGRRSKEGIIKTPGVVAAGELEFKYASGTSGGIDITVESASGQRGRQAWRQLP